MIWASGWSRTLSLLSVLCCGSQWETLGTFKGYLSCGKVDSPLYKCVSQRNTPKWKVYNGLMTVNAMFFVFVMLFNINVKVYLKLKEVEKQSTDLI